MVWHPQPRPRRRRWSCHPLHPSVLGTKWLCSFSREIPWGAPAWDPSLHGSRNPGCTGMGTNPLTRQACPLSLFLDKAHACGPEHSSSSAWPQIPYRLKQGWLHWAFSSSCSHPAALLPPSVMTFPLPSQGESQICLQSLLGGFARPSAKHQRVNG